MKKPIVIDSIVEFVIIGPIGNADGILVKSENIKAELIGFAYLFYRSGFEAVSKQQNPKFCRNIWGDISRENGRKDKLLFCAFTGTHANSVNEKKFLEVYLNLSIQGKMDENSLSDAFKVFIEDSYSELLKLIDSNDSKPINYDLITAKITWNLSMLILTCHF